MITPASTLNSSPVTYRDSSDDANLARRELSEALKILASRQPPAASAVH
jgi:hypothetical protein